MKIKKKVVITYTGIKTSVFYYWFTFSFITLSLRNQLRKRNCYKLWGAMSIIISTFPTGNCHNVVLQFKIESFKLRLLYNLNFTSIVLCVQALGSDVFSTYKLWSWASNTSPWGSLSQLWNKNNQSTYYRKLMRKLNKIKLMKYLQSLTLNINLNIIYDYYLYYYYY